MARRKKPDEDPSQDDQNNNSDDTFGLPEIEYEPLQRDEPARTEPESVSEPAYQQPETHKQMEREEVQPNEYNTTYYNDEDEGGSPWPKILGIAAFLLISAAVVYYFAVYRPDQQKTLAAEKLKMEQEAERKRIADYAEQQRLEEERRIADSLANSTQASAGVIDTLTERTGRYYVIIASAIDGDLIMDYAKKLAPKGLNPKIIPPHGNVKFYRLAIAEGDTYASTQATADQLKGEYTEGTWVVKW